MYRSTLGVALNLCLMTLMSLYLKALMVMTMSVSIHVTPSLRDLKTL